MLKKKCSPDAARFVVVVELGLGEIEVMIWNAMPLSLPRGRASSACLQRGTSKRTNHSNNFNQLGCREGTAQHWEALPAPRLAEKIHRECQAKMKGARAPHCKEPIPSPGRHKGLMHVQSKAGCFFLPMDFIHSMFAEAGLIWGRWRVVLSAGDVKPSILGD